MKQRLPARALALVTILLFFALTNCREVFNADRPYQRVLVNDFSIPLKTLLPGRTTYPSKLTLRVNGSINKPVALAVNYLDSGRSSVRRDTLAAGTYTDKTFRDDFYSKDQIELTVIGTPGTTGALTIEWYAQ